MKKQLISKFTCNECRHTFKSIKGLSNHVSRIHDAKQYYDTWLSVGNDHLCKICGSETEFISISRGYKNGCCREHIVQWNHIKIDEAILKKYGVKSILCLEDYKKNGMIKKYGVDNAFKSEIIKNKIKETNLLKYGVENVSQSKEIKQKIVNTCIKNLGVKYPSQSPIIKEKIKQTFKNKYNVECALQDETLFNKQQKTACYLHTYKNSKIYYRGSYEYDFLEKYYNKFIDIENGKFIKYEYQGKNKIYYPDFYIPSLNLIVECKNSYLLKRDNQIIEAKKKAVIDNGFKYIMIVDKNYNEFEYFISNLII